MDSQAVIECTKALESVTKADDLLIAFLVVFSLVFGYAIGRWG